MRTQSFQIKVPHEILYDLQARLNQTRWTDEVEGAG